MTNTLPSLSGLIEASCRRHPERTAVEDAGSSVTYAGLDALAEATAARLRSLGIGAGDRVGIHLRKSIDSVAALYGILKTGAAYVPVDPTGPAARNAGILADCGARAVFVDAAGREGLARELDALGTAPALFDCGAVGGGNGLRAALSGGPSSVPAADSAVASPPGLAYVLYTSGSTGRPKGVMLTHENAMAFVNWCSETFAPVPGDRFSSHAPFHFDLSILDIYLSLKHGATLVLVGEELGKDPTGLSAFIADRRLTVWYSTPSILSLLVGYGRIEKHDLSSLRMIFFAGEVFPVGALRRLKSLVPRPRYYNLYGPTETNVCTWYEIPEVIPEDRTAPFPIGHVCPHYEARVEDENGSEAPPGTPGELLISGAGVTSGYWNLPERTAAAFRRTPDGRSWYRTGDIVTDPGDGCFIFVGRRDRMVKRRGYRVELDEIEAALHRHPDVREAAVISQSDEMNGVRIRAFVCAGNGAELSIIAMKKFCMEVLPAWMVPDFFSFPPSLPKTSTDKTDYQRLVRECG